MMHTAHLRRASANKLAPMSRTATRRSASTIPTPPMRMKKLKELMASQELVRMLEVHNGLTALVSDRCDGMLRPALWLGEPLQSQKAGGVIRRGTHI